MHASKRLGPSRALCVLAFGGLNITAAGAGMIHAVTQSAKSLGSTEFLNTSSSGAAVEAQVGSAMLSDLKYSGYADSD